MSYNALPAISRKALGSLKYALKNLSKTQGSGSIVWMWLIRAWLVKQNDVAFLLASNLQATHWSTRYYLMVKTHPEPQLLQLYSEDNVSCFSWVL